MMEMTIAQKFNKDIAGEKIFYTKESNFSQEEAELVFDSVFRRMATNLFYTSMITKRIPILENEILPKIDAVQKAKEIDWVERNIERHNNMYYDLIMEEHDYGLSLAMANYGLGRYKNYFNEVCNNPLDAEKFEEIISSDFACVCPVTRDMLVTANFLFMRCSDFYTDEYVETLRDMIQYNNKNRILDKEELKTFNEAEKTTLQHIKKYYKKKKKEAKQLKKVKKL